MAKRCILAFHCAAMTLAIFSAPQVQAETITQFLREFHSNPAKTMHRLPDIVDSKGVAHPSGYISADEMGFIRERNLDFQVNVLSKSALKRAQSAEPLLNDDVANLLDPGTSIERNIGTMQAQGLNNLTVPTKPWSDSYWPTFRGQIAFRYADSEKGTSELWAQNYDFAATHPASGIVSNGDGARISLLSPAEKYDFVMGDLDFTLTKVAWERGRASSDDGIGVASWMGICHGWSAAASMGVPFIGHDVTVTSTNGVPVTFYPQDIKALESMLWANASPSARFISGRCKVANPKRNSFGRVTDPDCFDTNPATWHLAVVNQLGRNKRSFVFDGDPGAEVWNFPLQAARYRYFNPQTFEESANWKNARIPFSRFTMDKFKEFRSKNTVSIIGIYMDVTYPIEIEPGPKRIFDAPTKTVRYVYDLELDSGDNVIGGEWYSILHPDFLWTFDKDAQAMALDESVLESDNWVNTGPVPSSWTVYAKRASVRGAPLSIFLKRVINAAGPVQQP